MELNDICEICKTEIDGHGIYEELNDRVLCENCWFSLPRSAETSL